MLKVAIVGCGKIANEHALQIRRIPGCRLVGFCDTEPLMAKQMHERFDGAPYFDDIRELLSDVQPDVVHITTSPQSHLPLAQVCLDAGCHAYIEKPFTLNTEQARQLISTATQRRRKVTVGHSAHFTGPANRMRALIRDGFLGGRPLHVESYYGYDLGDGGYARAFLGDTNHWVRKLPGMLLQNIISHGIGRISEHLRSDSPTVIAHAFTSQALKTIGETEILDELRVILHDDPMTAYFTFSTQIRPHLAQLRVYGPKGALIIDDNQETLIRLKGARYKSYLENFIPPMSLASQYAANSAASVRRFLTHQLNVNAGMKSLIERFYRSIRNDDPVPIPYREILLTSTVMDSIFSQIDHRRRTSLHRTGTESGNSVNGVLLPSKVALGSS